ncbi:hypothetical protein [Streptomyces sp. NPDC088725]|uniref:hypothetical protein n=1 Tax=Streptomyces sp. NPDC088725 TaxID=3365873 RepID=UPI003823CBE1
MNTSDRRAIHAIRRPDIGKGIQKEKNYVIVGGPEFLLRASGTVPQGEKASIGRLA